MSKPSEHKSVHSLILKYAEEIRWAFVSRMEAEKRRGFTSTSLSTSDATGNKIQ